MSEQAETTEQTEVEQPNGAQTEAATTEEKDWKALARMWENRAKSHKEKADKYDELQEASKSELQKAIERAEKAEADAKALKDEAERNALVSRVASEKGVPASLLVGDDEESLAACADALLAFASGKQPNIPADKGGAATKRKAASPAESFAAALGITIEE